MLIQQLVSEVFQKLSLKDRLHFLAYYHPLQVNVLYSNWTEDTLFNAGIR